jgi:branched-chain amino acid transport system substrate-binding protein
MRFRRAEPGLLVRLLAALTTVLAAGTIAAGTPDVVVGLSVAQSGPYAHASQEQWRGFQLWVEETNARGGLLGRRIVVRQGDDQSRPETAGRLYEQFGTENRAAVLIGPYSSPSTLAAAVAASKHGIPMISAGASATEIWGQGRNHVFGLYTPASAHLDPVLEFAKSRGLKRVALLYEDSPFQREVAAGVKARAKSLGMSVVFEEKYDKGTGAFASTITKIKSKRPDAVIGGSYLPETVAFMRQAKEGKLYARLFAFSIGPALTEFGARLGLDAEGVIGTSQWEPDLPLPEAGQFAERFQAKYGHRPSTEASGGYAAGQVLGEAVRKAGSLDGDKLRAALRELETVTVLGPYRVDATGRQVGKSAYVVQWIDGVRHVVLPEDVAARKPAYPFRDWAKR